MQHALDNLRRQCTVVDESWIKRKRKLTTWGVLSVLMRAAAQPVGLRNHVALEPAWNFSDVALHKARIRMPQGAFAALYRQMLPPAGPRPRVFAVDGTKVRLPPSVPPDGFQRCAGAVVHPSALISCLTDVATDVVHDLVISRSHNERAAALCHLPHVRAGDTLVFDRGYWSRDMAASLLALGVRFVFRVKTARGGAPLAGMRRGGPATLPSRRLGDPALHGRVVRYRIDGHEFTLFVSPEIAHRDAREMYRTRWRVEESFRSLKCRLNLEHTVSRLPRLFEQEV
jgi:hypothetical protein